jgi:6-phosphogluconolactonase
VNAASNNCAEIFIGPSGAFLYGSNRGHDSIALFSIDAASGNVTSKGTTPSGGGVPRNFAISPDGKTLIAANESGNLTTFAIDGATGALTKLKGLDVPPKPQFVGIAMLPGGG